MKKMSTYNEICGVIHVHFSIKNWGKCFEEILKDGERAKVDFVILTTHTPKRKKGEYKLLFNLEGYYKNLYVIHGEEFDEKKKNHLILIGRKDWIGEENIFEGEKNIIKLVVHPYGKHRLFFVKKNYMWQKWNEKFDGMEIWSLLFDWADKTRIYNIPLRYLFFPSNVSVPNEKILRKWDILNLERKVIGFAGLDIHSLPLYLKIFDFRNVFSYKNVFKTLRNHIYLKEKLTGNFEIDKMKILNAIKKGNLFFSNDFLEDSSGFYFGEKRGNYFCGEGGKIGDIILIKNPVAARTKLIRNGEVIIEEKIMEEEYKVEKEGNYRVEVYFKNRNWIFSNNIYIRGEKNGEKEI